MKNVEILLRENVDSLGMCGDVVKVAPGYARNYLVPYGKAVQATPENKRLMDRRRVRLEAEAAVKHAEMDAWIATLSSLTLTTNERADEAGHLYGSVSPAAIVALLAQKGHPVEERNVRIDTPIKQVGEHKVKVHVYGDKEAEMTVNVVAAAT